MMSKGLEKLKEIKDDVVGEYIDEYKEHFDIIEKELKALEIIKNKITNKDSSKVFYPFYKDLKGDFHIVLTQEEYGLLKEVLL